MRNQRRKIRTSELCPRPNPADCPSPSSVSTAILFSLSLSLSLSSLPSFWSFLKTRIYSLSLCFTKPKFITRSDRLVFRRTCKDAKTQDKHSKKENKIEKSCAYHQSFCHFSDIRAHARSRFQRTQKSWRRCLVVTTAYIFVVDAVIIDKHNIHSAG